MKMPVLAAACAALSVFFSGGPALAIDPAVLDGLKLGLSVSDMEQVGQRSLGIPGEMDRNRRGDPELSFATACRDRGRTCVSADVDFTATALGEEAYLVTVRTRYAKPIALSRVVEPLKRRYGRVTKRLTQSVQGNSRRSRQVVHLVWGDKPERAETLETYSGKIDLLARSDLRKPVLMLLDVDNGKVHSYTLMVMDRDLYARNLAFHEGTDPEPIGQETSALKSDISVAR